jgi:hypothetical protein
MRRLPERPTQTLMPALAESLPVKIKKGSGSYQFVAGPDIPDFFAQP